MSELLEGKQAPERIYGVSQSQFSIARYYGGCKAFGETYHYDADTDSLVLVDVWNAQIRDALPKQKRTPPYKAINIPFKTEADYLQLVEAARKDNRKPTDFIKAAIKTAIYAKIRKKQSSILDARCKNGRRQKMALPSNAKFNGGL